MIRKIIQKTRPIPNPEPADIEKETPTGNLRLSFVLWAFIPVHSRPKHVGVPIARIFGI